MINREEWITREQLLEEIKQLRQSIYRYADLNRRTRKPSVESALLDAIWNENVRLRKENESLSDALDCVVSYWDEWKDAPDDHPTALSLEEVVEIAKETLGYKDN